MKGARMLTGSSVGGGWMACAVLWMAVGLVATLPASGQVVQFSHEGGFYADTFSLAMQIGYAPADEPFSIHYTFNGSEPTVCDARYERPIGLGSGCYSPSAIFRVPTVPEERWYAPDEVERIIVVRAAAFDTAGFRRSAVTTQSYLIESLTGRRIALPVMSLCTDSLSLFDHDTGLFVPGWYFDPRYPYSTGNYFQRGRSWERRAAMAFYDHDGTSFAQDCGLRVHGNSQRLLVQKGMSLYARREYGGRRFDHPFFGAEGAGSYGRIVLRPWATSWSGAGIEDWLCQHMAAPLRFDHLATRPVVLFLNGEYWGIYFMEEKADEHYVEEHYGVPHDEVDLLAYWGGEVENGTAARWNALADWMLAGGSDHAVLSSKVDVGAVMDYMLMQCIILNDDWPVSNVRQWSHGDGPWRWIFFDADGALSSFPDNAAILDYITYRSPGATSHTSPQSTLLFRRLLADRGFVEASMERLREIVDEHFDYRLTGALLQRIVGEVEGEVPSQIARFDRPSSMVRWRMAVEVIDEFLRSEPQAMVNEYAQYFGVPPRHEEGPRTVFDRYGRPVAQGTDELRATLPAGIYFVKQPGNGVIKWRIE